MGDAAALEIYRFLGQRVATAATQLSRCHASLVTTPDDDRASVREWLGRDWNVQPQGDGDLGARMSAAMVRSFDAGATQVVIVGTDCPDVNVDVFNAAFEGLATHDVVIGPAHDGGYYLIGMRAPCPALFVNVAWSSPQTLEQTLARAKEVGVTVTLLDARSDIDTEDDWRRWTSTNSWAAAEVARGSLSPNSLP